jgi:NAD(P)-dependent dehydrogenase (short-subunit alcohol dehydrogenase family)
MKDTEGKVAFITGGVSGIGLGIAKAFSAAGMKLAITYRRPEHRDAAMQYFRERPHAIVEPMQLDVTDRDAVGAAADEVERTFGEVHVVVNSAGVNLLGPMDEATYDDWDWLLSVNLGGIVNVLNEFLPKIKKHGKGGHVINVGSMASFITGPGFGVYATSKFAVRGLTESLRYSLARHRIGVSLLCPGLTRSCIYEAALHRPAHLSSSGVNVDNATISRLASLHALGMDPEDVGRKTLNALRRNDFYVFSHPEFRDEIREICEEILQALPAEEPDSKRLVFERMRVQSKEEARALIDALTGNSRI